MRFHANFTAPVRFLPPAENRPFLQHERKKTRLDRRQEVRVTELFSAVIELCFVDMRNAPQLGDAKARPIVVVMHRENAVGGHDALLILARILTGIGRVTAWLHEQMKLIQLA